MPGGKPKPPKGGATPVIPVPIPKGAVTQSYGYGKTVGRSLDPNREYESVKTRKRRER